MALLCSSGVSVLWSAGAWLLQRTANIEGPGIAVLMHIPGMKTITATPDWSPARRQQLPLTHTTAANGSDSDTAVVGAAKAAAAGTASDSEWKQQRRQGQAAAAVAAPAGEKDI